MPFRRIAIALAALAGLATALPAHAEVVVRNWVGTELRIKVGYAELDGSVEWKDVTLPQCFEMVVTEAPNLRMLHPSFLDERLNPDTGAIDYGVLLLTQPGVVTFFAAPPRVMYDVVDRGTPCVLAPAP